MFEITVQAGFSSGHYLRNYHGKCENPHGHNYRVLVTLIGEELDHAGLLLDFKLLKQVLRPTVEYLDHQMINDLEPFTVINPSAENLARYFYDKTATQLHEMTAGRVRVKDCTLYETDTSFARYYETEAGSSMHLIELYKSVQGESSFAGLPCIFVRLAGCNLRCSWCDSEYTFTGGQPFTANEIITQIEALAPCRLIEFTGGEPMLQARELLPLMTSLLEKNYTLMIETSGEQPLAGVPRAVHKIVDVKCPGAGAAANTFRLENLTALTPNDEVKFVLTDRADYEFARDFIRTHNLASLCGNILLSPAFLKAPSDQRSTENCALDPRLVVEWMLADGLPARLSLQIHKYIWEPRKKGV